MNMRHLNHGLVAAMTVWGASTAFAQQTQTHQQHNSGLNTSSSSSTHSTTAGQNNLDRKDISFIKDAAQGGMAEVQLGQMAASQAQNSQVKQLGERLQQDHSKANQELMQIAQRNGVNLPNDTAKKENHAETQLHGKSGADFDKAFVEHALKDHEKDIRKFEKASQDTKDPELKAWIQKQLPALREHLQMARTAGAAVGVDQKTLTAADRFLSEQGQTSSRSLNNRNEGLGTAGSTESGRSSSSGSSLDKSGTSTHGTTERENSSSSSQNHQK